MTAETIFEFRLFVADGTPNSAQAFGNINSLCKKHLPERYSIDVVDLLREPGRALAEGVFLTPTLVRLAPAPTLRVVGTLNDEATVMLALGLQEMPP